MDSTPIWQIGAIPITQVVVVTWGVMALLVFAAAVLRMKLRKRDPGLMQQAVSYTHLRAHET